MSTMASSNSAGSAAILAFVCKFMQRASASLACVALLKHHKALLTTWCGKEKSDSLCFTQQEESLQSACKQVRDPWSIIIFKGGRNGDSAAAKLCRHLWLFSMELLLCWTEGMFFMGLCMLWKDKVNNLEIMALEDVFFTLSQNHCWEKGKEVSISTVISLSSLVCFGPHTYSFISTHISPAPFFPFPICLFLHFLIATRLGRCSHGANTAVCLSFKKEISLLYLRAAWLFTCWLHWQHSSCGQRALSLEPLKVRSVSKRICASTRTIFDPTDRKHQLCWQIVISLELVG